MPNDDARRKADKLLDGVDLGDWSILLDDTADDLREIYGDGLAEGLRLTNMGVDLDQVNQRALDWARERAAALVTQIEENTRDMIRDTVAEAIDQGWSADQLASELTVSGGFDSDRAMLISRTELIAAQNKGNLAGYKQARDSGVRVMKEWISAGDDLVSEECQENEDEGPIDLDDNFPSGDDSPPAHPNAVFAGTSFATYGRLIQALRSRYNGPAVTIEAALCEENREFAAGYSDAPTNLCEGDILSEQLNSVGDLPIRNRSWSPVGVIPSRINLTIGPNHPVLTRRGIVLASELYEGDQLLYDVRVQLPASGIESDFEKMPLIEDAFATLFRRFDNVNVAAAGSYFHGDQVFTYGEVQAIRPTGDLLPILDPCGIEHLCECDFVGAYPEATHVAGCGTCRAAFDRIFLAASSGVSGGGSCPALIDARSFPPFFRAFTIVICHKSSFSGWAFDASTESAFYNYGGIVVKNCRCAVTPYLPDEDESEQDEDEG